MNRMRELIERKHKLGGEAEKRSALFTALENPYVAPIRFSSDSFHFNLSPEELAMNVLANEGHDYSYNTDRMQRTLKMLQRLHDLVLLEHELAGRPVISLDLGVEETARHDYWAGLSLSQVFGESYAEAEKNPFLIEDSLTSLLDTWNLATRDFEPLHNPESSMATGRTAQQLFTAIFDARADLANLVMDQISADLGLCARWQDEAVNLMKAFDEGILNKEGPDPREHPAISEREQKTLELLGSIYKRIDNVSKFTGELVKSGDGALSRDIYHVTKYVPVSVQTLIPQIF